MFQAKFSTNGHPRYADIDAKITQARKDMEMYLRLAEADPQFLAKYEDAEETCNKLLDIRSAMRRQNV